MKCSFTLCFKYLKNGFLLLPAVKSFQLSFRENEFKLNHPNLAAEGFRDNRKKYLD